MPDAVDSVFKNVAHTGYSETILATHPDLAIEIYIHLIIDLAAWGPVSIYGYVVNRLLIGEDFVHTHCVYVGYPLF